MQRIFKTKVKIDFKYILIELLLIVAGILLAMKLNSWSNQSKLGKEVSISMDRVAKEIASNHTELAEAIAVNDSLVLVLSQLAQFSDQHITTVICQPSEMIELRRNFSDYFTVLDSVPYQDRQAYTLSLIIELEYAELSDVAWETARLANLTNHYQYDCLKDLLFVYDFQELYTEVQEGFLQYETMQDEDRFAQTLLLNHRMAEELEGRYADFLKDPANCMR